jgi:hypothetical protein
VQSKGQTGDPRVRSVQPKGLTSASVKKSGMSKSEHPVANGGKDHVKHNGKRPKLTFDELLAKYQKDNEAKRANRSNKVKSSRLSPKHNSGNWNREGKICIGFDSYWGKASPPYIYEGSRPIEGNTIESTITFYFLSLTTVFQPPCFSSLDLHNLRWRTRVCWST